MGQPFANDVVVLSLIIPGQIPVAIKPQWINMPKVFFFQRFSPCLLTPVKALRLSNWLLAWLLVPVSSPAVGLVMIHLSNFMKYLFIIIVLSVPAESGAVRCELSHANFGLLM